MSNLEVNFLGLETSINDSRSSTIADKKSIKKICKAENMYYKYNGYYKGSKAAENGDIDDIIENTSNSVKSHDDSEDISEEED